MIPFFSGVAVQSAGALEFKVVLLLQAANSLHPETMSAMRAATGTTRPTGVEAVVGYYHDATMKAGVMKQRGWILLGGKVLADMASTDGDYEEALYIKDVHYLRKKEFELRLTGGTWDTKKFGDKFPTKKDYEWSVRLNKLVTRKEDNCPMLSHPLKWFTLRNFGRLKKGDCDALQGMIAIRIKLKEDQENHAAAVQVRLL